VKTITGGVPYSVAVSGDTVVLGDYAFAEAAYVFYRDHGGADNWGLVATLTASDGYDGAYFGKFVAISGDTIVVGAHLYGSQQGAAYVFNRNEGGTDSWGQVAKLTASDGERDDYFGVSVAISGDTIVVGATGDEDYGYDSGSAYIFYRNQGGPNAWGQVTKLLAPNGAVEDNFGWDASINGDIVVVGSYKYDINVGPGEAFVYYRNNGGADAWGLVATLMASDGADYDSFGYSVSINSDIIVAGAPGSDLEEGSAYIFYKDQGGADNWGEVKKIKASDGAEGDYFGYAVSINGDTVVAGAKYDDDKGTSSGSAYVFLRNNLGVDNWGEATKLTASDSTEYDYFGKSVATDSDTVIIGALYPAYVYYRFDNSGSGEYRYKLDDSNLTSGAIETTETSYTPAEELSEGTHTFYVQELDEVGNWSVSGSAEVMVDLSHPSSNASPPGGVYNSYPVVFLLCNDGNGSGCANIYYTTDGSTPTTSSSVYTNAIAITSDTTLKFFATNLAGNEEAVNTEVYEIADTAAPPDRAVTFTDSGQLLNGESVFGVALGDVDSDGDLDAFTTSTDTDSANTLWLYNAATNEFYDSGQSLGNERSAGVALGDIDSDGYLDAFVGMTNSPDTVWVNDGSGTFSNSGQTLDELGYTFDAEFGDLNGDGNPDIFAGSAAYPVWLNDGSGTFADNGQIGMPSLGIGIGDLDGDSDLDVFWTTDWQNKVWLNDGNGTFTDTGQGLGTLDSCDVALGDLDSDGDLDAFVVNGDSPAGENKVWLNDGSGTFTDSGQSLVGDTSNRGVALGDLDIDGDLDALVTTDSGLEVWLNDGGGLFTDSGLRPGEGAGRRVQLGDFDRDGDLDAFVTTFYGSEVWWNGLDARSPVTTASPPGGLYNAVQTVTLSCDDADGSGCATIYYTTDGSMPTTVSSVYSGSISIFSEGETKLKFFSIDN
ncbi:MAG: FG-GAP-like repeat-containing protein, partial [Planctomycetota bacterium]